MHVDNNEGLDAWMRNSTWRMTNAKLVLAGSVQLFDRLWFHFNPIA
jgi:hypothetical protein